MKKLIYKSQDIEKDCRKLFDYIKNYEDKKLLIVNLTQENRELEKQLEIESLIIYNSYDYFLGTCDLEKAIFEFDDDIHILPSTVKTEDEVIDLSILDRDLESMEVEQVEDESFDSEVDFSAAYKQILVIYDQKSNLINDTEYDLLSFTKPGLFNRILGIFKGRNNG